MSIATLIKESPATLTDLIRQTRQSWVTVATELDRLLEDGTIGLSIPGNSPHPLYFYLGTIEDLLQEDARTLQELVKATGRTEAEVTAKLSQLMAAGHVGGPLETTRRGVTGIYYYWR